MARSKPRRPKGTGSISPRKDGRFDAELKLRDWDGEIVRHRTTKNTKLEADRWLTKLKYEHERNLILAGDAATITVARFLDLWLEDAVKGTVLQSTYDDYALHVRVHLKPALGRLKLQDLTTRHLQALYRKKTEDGLSPRTVLYIHTVIRKALTQAEGWDLVRKNVAKWAKPPRIEYTEKPFLEVAHAKAFLQAIRGDRLEALYILAVSTGLRRGELLGLKWDDLDLEKGTLAVSRAGPQKPTTKTKAGRRPAVLPHYVVDALRRHKAHVAQERLALGPLWRGSPDPGQDYVFPSTIGTALRGGNVLDRSLKPLMRKAGLPPHTFQVLRRSTPTFLVLLKVHPRVAQWWMGHASITTTMNVYAQVPEELQAEAAALMGELLFGPKEEENH